jgi:alkylated DNA repair dioxygenase AlkB
MGADFEQRCEWHLFTLAYRPYIRTWGTEDPSMSAQADLFSSEIDRFTIDTAFSKASRQQLDETSWVDIVPDWISGTSELFEWLQRNVPWAQHDRKMFDQTFREPRLTASFPSFEATRSAAICELGEALSQHYGVRFDGLWLNWYRSGEDSTGWHRDRFACREAECIVPVLTIGAVRRFLLKPRHGGRSVVFKPGSGHLLVMGGRCQQDWVHCIPKAPGVAEPRISLNFQSSSQAQNGRNPTPETLGSRKT